MPSHTLNPAVDAAAFTVTDLLHAADALGVKGSQLVSALYEPEGDSLSVDKSTVTTEDIETAAGYLKLPPMVLMGLMLTSGERLPEPS